MNSIMIMLSLFILINKIIKMINNINNKKNFMNNLECGFNNLNNLKINYSMNFIYILIIFIMFDIEMMIFIPIMLKTKINLKFTKMLNIFLMFMILSTMLELKNKKIIWMI